MPDIEEMLDRIYDLFNESLEMSVSIYQKKKYGVLSRARLVRHLKSIQRISSVVYASVSEYEETEMRGYLNEMKRNMDEIVYLINCTRKIRAKYREVLSARDVPVTDQKGIVSCLEKGYYNSSHWLTTCLGNPIYSFVENARIIVDTRIFPEKLRNETREMLDKLGFEEVIEILSGVDENLIQEHSKDCVDNCRKALMRVVEHLVLELKEEPKTSFEGNMSILVNHRVIDKIEKRDFISFFSTLSQRSQHEMLGSETKLSPSDCVYLIDMTYARLKRILLKFKAFQD